MKRHTYEFIKQEIEKENYQLLSTEYIDKSTHLYIICPSGHQYKITWAKWKQGQRCPCITNKMKPMIDFVKQTFEQEGYKLISSEYKNNYSYLNFICPNGHKHKITWHNWKQGTRCRKCSYDKRKVLYNFIKQSFEKEGYQLLSTEYFNAHQYLEFICLNGHKHKIIWNAWQQGIRCGKCIFRISKPEREIQEYIKENYNGIVKTNDRTMILNPISKWYLELDIWLPEIRKAIEYNSKYYHNIDVKWKDKYKQQWCKDNEIELLIIDDNKWRKNKDFNIINNFIGV